VNWSFGGKHHGSNVMARYSCSPRYSHLIPEEMRDPDLEQLKQLVLSPEGPGWQFSEAGIDYFLDDGRKHHLIVLGDTGLGYYLHFLGPDGCFGPDDIRLSLGDRSRLSEVICPDDWEASAGLFVSRVRAWEAIRHFCMTGERSPAIEWITIDEMPEDGNW
jgi:hypothetical protein